MIANTVQNFIFLSVKEGKDKGRKAERQKGTVDINLQ